MPGGPRLVLVLATSLALAAGCGQDRPTPPPSAAGAYVVVAVDNHFHDIHPGDRKRLPSSGGFVVRNEGRNLHNVTIPGTDVNVDLEPGESLEWPRLGDVLQPGVYDVVCRYHDWDGMTGRFRVVPDGS